MKKIFVFILSFILLIIFALPVFCNENYEIDPYTQEIISDIGGNGTETVTVKRISSNCNYDLEQKLFIYTFTESSSVYFTSTVSDKEQVSEAVVIDAENAGGIVVYRNGVALGTALIYQLSDPGYYIVKSSADDSEIISFTVLEEYISNMDKYEIPSMYFIVNAYLDGEKISPSSTKSVTLTNEGKYTINYKCNSLSLTRSVEFTIDRTAPELVIEGVTDGIAYSSVTLGDREDGSTLEVLLNGESLKEKNSYANFGTYHMVYTDAAGNSSTYDFTIRFYLDVNAGIIIGIIVAAVAGVIGYMVYLRKHMKVC